jgi:hypothetical protein
MKRNILLILLCVCFIVSYVLCGSFVSLAAEVEEGEIEEVPEEVPYENITTPEHTDTDTEDNIPHTILTRVWEYVNKYKTIIAGVAGDAVILLSIAFIRFKSKRKTKGMISDLTSVKNDATDVVAAQEKIVNAVNHLIGSYNEMREVYERYENVEDERNKLVGAVMVQNTALLEILTTVYAHNKHLPQGLKDIVNLKYANCHKMLNNDQTLCAIVESVRRKVSDEPKAEISTSEPTEV